ncbi:uncharacterized protein LOC142356455, partial [Convolutriloba macropyga]|uniref:uncharacterized protein LOC142356455 n=1 Tax=Convolutriloba macropyga TaxID=536237 RepID=UPI003F523A1A
MHYRVIIFLSGAFILLLVFTIVQQIKDFVERQKNPVSSIDFIHDPTGHHESAVALMTAMILSQKNGSRIDLSFAEFEITDKCVCLNMTAGHNNNTFINCTNIIKMNHQNNSDIGS